ncbi:hypothetical protein IKQ21_01235 [bacterium]|nr:hypothetical protein [bacterium]
MRLISNIIYGILAVQEKILRHRLSRTIVVKNTSKRKRHFGDGVLLDLNSMADIEKERMEAEITNLLKTYDYEPEKILKYIEKQGTKVFYTPEAKKLLNPIGENEGFVFPAKGSKALYLALGIEKKFKLKTDEMFVLSKGEINKYYFIYHFYNWYAFKHGIAGMDSESQELLKKFLFSQDADTKELQLADIYKLKDAIKQDKASIEFVVKLCRNYDGAKNALEKLQDGGANL